MKLSKFKFNLPQELIALHPAKNRDESRLMVVNRKTGEIEHKVFKDLLSYFGEKDVFIFNNTKVFPARLHPFDYDIFICVSISSETYTAA